MPRTIVEFALLGPTNDRRQLQDSPILGDVWIAFGGAPDEPVELLIEPHWQKSAGKVAVALDEAIERSGDEGPEIAALHGVVAARLFFDEVIRFVVPRTSWWNKRMTHDRFLLLRGDPAAPGAAAERSEQKGDVLARAAGAAMSVIRLWRGEKTPGRDEVVADDGTLPALDRFLALVMLIFWAREQEIDTRVTSAQARDDVMQKLLDGIEPTVRGRMGDVLRMLPTPVPPKRESKEEEQIDIIWQVSLNRSATPALIASVPAVKGDAARRLFAVNCQQIAWAILDSGINGGHPAFKDDAGNPRVKRSFDFTNIREIVSLDNVKEDRVDRRLTKLLDENRGLLDPPKTREEAVGLLKDLADDVRRERPVHWDFVRKFVEIKPATLPRASDHGTHVAGIIGASAVEEKKHDKTAPLGDGMCPDIQLWDFRVLAPGLKETEFAIIAALQFIRFVNSQTDYMSIHGANLSLSIRHDVRNYACGRTPICLECERLVESGVMVVAAAGNLGYQSFQTTEGSYDGYAAFSVTDPGNAEGVLTVGSTHRSAPHTYGVSFFSSRGPTGDGRAKPDLVAPGERINAPFRDGWGDLDGTSMAAPHASGAAAMLMARYAELIGQPRRVKKILCDSATDLGRERSFQGYGMLDVLRAFQSI